MRIPLAAAACTLMALMMIVSGDPIIAATPTPTAIPSVTPGGRSYARSELLTQMAPVAVNATAAFQGLQLPQVSVGTIAGGVGIGKTFQNMLTAAGVFSFIFGLILLMFIIYWLRKQLVQLTNKREVSPQEKELKQFRKEFKSFRGSFRAKRRR